MQHKRTLEGLKDSPSLYGKRQSMNTFTRFKSRLNLTENSHLQII